MALGLCLMPFVQSCDKEKELKEETGTAAVTGVSLDKDSLLFVLGDVTQQPLTATVAPEDAAVKTVTWSTTNNAVATVVDGLVTAVAAGTASIVVTTTEGSFTDTCKVTVNEAAVPWEVDSTYLYQGIWYKVVRAGEVAVVQNPAGQDYRGTITVPARVNGATYEVKYVATRAFGYEDQTPEENTHIEYVNLPGTIISFANCAFQNNRSLKKIEIPNSVRALSDDDYDGADDLTAKLEDGITPASVGATFMNCTGLEEVTIGAGITSLVAAHGIFNNHGYAWASRLKKLTCLAATPPAFDGNSFMLGVDYAVFYVPQGSEGAYKDAVAGTIWAWTYGEAANVYAVGSCVPVWSLSATNVGELTWGGDDNAYNVVISTTELEDPSTGTVRRATETTFDASDYVTSNTTNYVYVKSECSDSWASTSFFPPIENGCEYTVSGIDTWTGVDEDNNPVGPYAWGSSVEFWQNDLLIATVSGDAAFGDGTTVTLISGVEVTVKWTGKGGYDDICTLLIKQGDADILSKDDLKDNEANPNLHTFTPSCSN